MTPIRVVRLQRVKQAFVSKPTAAELRPERRHDELREPPSRSVGAALPAISPGIKRLENDTDHSVPLEG